MSDPCGAAPGVGSGVVAVDEPDYGCGESVELNTLEAAYLSRRPDLIRMLRTRGNSMAEAEDIVQEVFLRALRVFRERRAPDNLFGWLVTSARNAVIDRFRRMRREITASPDVWARLEYSSTDRDADEGGGSLIERERLSRVSAAIESLREIERQCLVLRGHGRKFHEIGEELGIPLRTAAYHTAVAIEKVRLRVGE